jgi:hypothetical protein
MPGMSRIQAVTVLFEGFAGYVEHFRGPAQVAGSERDFSLGDDTSRAGNCLFRPEGTRRTSQESLRAWEIAKLRHGNSPERKGRRIVAQRDPFECAEGIARRERTGCSCDH